MAKSKAGAVMRAALARKLMLLGFRSLQVVSASWASWFAYKLWFYPPRPPKAKRRTFAPPGTSAGVMHIEGKRVPYWVAGEGRAVLLVHGWSGWGGQMASIASALLQAGYRVAWFDAPAHGQAQGWQSNLFEFAACIEQLQSRVGPFETLIAHSFGAPSAFYAVSQGLDVARIVSISAPSSTTPLVEGFCGIIGATQATREALLGRFEAQFGGDVLRRISAAEIAPAICQPVLVIHDKLDDWVSIKDGIALRRKLPDVEWLVTEGLGHQRILRDKSVLQRVLAFMEPAGQGDDCTELPPRLSRGG